ncbi:MAG: carboxy terminal-processing peptidase [Alcanivoracaceae bacterium]|jgi:carboxyl-terminal processing protease|nr:carboxy terminal-processing peptidase [Alcanivoracaceae bacterium]
MRKLSFAHKIVIGLALSASLAMGAISFTVVPPAEPAVDQQNASGLQPEAVHGRTVQEIIARLERHYHNRRLNDELSAEVLERYLRDLDPNRLYFLQSDIEEFNQYQHRLDDQLGSGNLSAGYVIYNRYQIRVEESLTQLLSLLEQGIDKLDMNRQDSVLVDRREAHWPKDQSDKQDLWRKRLKDAVLTMRINGDKEEEIGSRLQRRYSGQLKRLQQSTPEDVFQIYINALTTSYDPHTNYYTPHNSENFTISMSRSLEGIGAVLQGEDEFTKVVRLVPGGPAAKGGVLKAADRIVGVAQGDQDVINVVGWRLDEVVNLIRGPKGTTVRLEVVPAGSPSEHNTRLISIVRNKVVLEDQAAKSRIIELPNGDDVSRIGVIDIPTFYLDFEAMHRGDAEYTSTTRDVAKLIMQLKSDDIDGLIIDLRDNGGGALPEATQLVSLFIDRGPTVQVRDARGRVSAEPDQYPGKLYSGPMAVLVNRHSASASEIFAGAMQDYGRALIVGDETFGKGTVQTLIPLNHGQLKMTQAKFYRVSGGSNQHRGVIPDLSLPFVIDKSEIGESALPNALPWDQIRPASFSPSDDLTPFIEPLRRSLNKRIARDPEFDYIREQIAMLDEMSNIRELPLNEQSRRKYQKQTENQRLAVENRLRRSRGLEPLKDVRSLIEEEEQRIAAIQSGEKQEDEKDAWLLETGRVLVDLIGLTSDARMAILKPAA